jgi:hypothetical protein
MESMNDRISTRCPHCEHGLTAEEIKSLWSTYTTSLRQTMGGPKRQKRPCQSCGMVCDSARGAWDHCRIPRGLGAEALRDYVLDRMPKELAGALGKRHSNLESLRNAVADIQRRKLKPAEKRQAKWYAGFIDKALGKLENAA